MCVLCICIWIDDKCNISRGPFCRPVVQLIEWYTSICHLSCSTHFPAQSNEISFLIHEFMATKHTVHGVRKWFNRFQYFSLFISAHTSRGISPSRSSALLLLFFEWKIESTTPRFVCVRRQLNNWNGNGFSFNSFGFHFECTNLRFFPICIFRFVSHCVHTINVPLLIFFCLFFISSKQMMRRTRCGKCRQQFSINFNCAHWIWSELKVIEKRKTKNWTLKME